MRDEDAVNGFAAFWSAHPRPVQRAKSKELFDQVVSSGVPEARLVTAARWYALRAQSERLGRFTNGTVSWLENRCWEEAPIEPAPNQSEGSADVAAFWAKAVRAGRFIPATAISTKLAQEMLTRELVRPEQLRAIGIDA